LLAICLSAVEQDGSSISKCNRPVLALGVDTLTALFSGRFGDVRQRTLCSFVLRPA
jgi:hypothetical protein